MKIRNRMLPAGWYPATKESVLKEIKDFLSRYEDISIPVSIAGIVPHAGWTYSGDIACKVFSGISSDVETIIIIGGHLPPDNTILVTEEDAWETPFGAVQTDLDLLNEIKKHLAVKPDRAGDNTIEVNIPFLPYFFPKSKVIGIRAGSSSISIQLGKAIGEAASALGKKIGVIGSTDLTHYGSNYNFAPAGPGKSGLKWVKEVNDKAFIDAALNMNMEEMLKSANQNHAACSAGGAVTAVSFSKTQGKTSGKLVKYKTSYDVYPNESFVGYAGIVF